MNLDEFRKKWGAVMSRSDYPEFFMSIMDDIYIDCTKEQAIELITDYYDNADTLFNEFWDVGRETIDEAKKI